MDDIKPLFILDDGARVWSPKIEGAKNVATVPATRAGVTKAMVHKPLLAFISTGDWLVCNPSECLQVSAVYLGSDQHFTLIAPTIDLETLRKLRAA